MDIISFSLACFVNLPIRFYFNPEQNYGVNQLRPNTRSLDPPAIPKGLKYINPLSLTLKDVDWMI